MSASTFDRQRPEEEHGGEPTAIEVFSMLRGSEAELEAAACATLGVDEVDAGFSVVDYLRGTLQLRELNAAEMLLAVRLADGQHNGKLVWANRTEEPRPVVRRRQVAQQAPVSTQRRGQGVGGGVC